MTRRAHQRRGGRGRTRSASASRAVEVDGRRFDVTVLEPEPPWAELARRRRERAARAGRGGAAATRSSARCRAPCSRSRSPRATSVEAGQVICIVEAMKMENEIAAHRAGVVTELSVAPGEPVANGQVICVLAPGG